MVTVMLMTLFLALVGVGLWAYSHALLTDAAGQAARYAANADTSDAPSVSQRAADIMVHTLAANAASTVHCQATSLADDLTVEVHCTMAAPGILQVLSGILPDVDVTAHALREVP